jgi:hypothetical protein
VIFRSRRRHARSTSRKCSGGPPMANERDRGTWAEKHEPRLPEISARVARLGCRWSRAQSAGRRSGGVASDDATPQLHRAGGQSILERRQSLFVCSPERSQVEGYGRGRAPSTRPWWGPPRLGGGSRARRADVLRSGFASLRKPHAGVGTGSARTGTRTGSSTGTVSWLAGSRASTICRSTRRIASIGGL